MLVKFRGKERLYVSITSDGKMICTSDWNGHNGRHMSNWFMLPINYLQN